MNHSRPSRFKHLFPFSFSGCIFVIFTACCFQLCVAQQYSLVIKDGHVIDPKNNINTVMDVAIQDGKIALLAKNIDAKQGKQVVNAKGKYVVPGLIDIHGHVFIGTEPDHAYSNGTSSIPPRSPYSPSSHSSPRGLPGCRARRVRSYRCASGSSGHAPIRHAYHSASASLPPPPALLRLPDS